LKTGNEPPLDIRTVRRFTSRGDDGLLGHFQSAVLRSAFQPIFSIAHKRIVGYEALLRGRNRQGMPISPAEIFSSEKSEKGIVFLDRLCRYLHMGNFQRAGDRLNWLYLNVSPVVVCHGQKYGSYFKELLDEYLFPPSRVVIEIVEQPIADEDLQLDTVQYYKQLGCLIAIDDFGAGSSNFERIWTLAPHIVKLDRSMIVRACQNKRIRDLFPGIVSLLHQAGSLVLVEGIETEEQALVAIDGDADFVQGYYFAEPVADPGGIRDVSFDFDGLLHTFKTLSAARDKASEHSLRRHKELLRQAAAALRELQPLEKACAFLTDEESVIRCYLLLPDGRQAGSSVVARKRPIGEDPRFKPLEDARSADWFRRHYLRRALANPGQVQITRPYLSITGGHMCVTLSVMFSSPSGDRVLCCDLNG
jgi:EAL domain-containing protein (putative c-di-GMP-specific phosphodiesterase class I)